MIRIRLVALQPVVGMENPLAELVELRLQQHGRPQFTHRRSDLHIRKRTAMQNLLTINNPSRYALDNVLPNAQEFGNPESIETPAPTKNVGVDAGTITASRSRDVISEWGM